MKISIGITTAIVAAMFGSAGCRDSNTVTGSDSGNGTRFAEGVQKVADPGPPVLSGAWSGSIQFHPYSDDRHGNVVLPCDATASIEVFLSQDGSRLTGGFQSGCGGMLDIHGYVSGDRISGTLDSAAGDGFGNIYGTVSSDRIQFWTMKYIDEAGDGSRDTDGDGTVRSTDVDLRRSSGLGRVTPIRVDRVRLPRARVTR